MRLKLDGNPALADVNFDKSRVTINVTDLGHGALAANLELTASQTIELIKQLANALAMVVKD